MAQIDGGRPYHCWEELLERDGRTPIYGISKGDEYYPAVNMAGTVASLVNQSKAFTILSTVKEIEYTTGGKVDLNKFFSIFKNAIEERWYFTKIYFAGTFPEQLVQLSPFRFSYERKRIFELVPGQFIKAVDLTPPRKGDIVIYLDTKDKNEVEKTLSKKGLANKLELIPAKSFSNDSHQFLDEIESFAKGRGVFKDSANVTAFKRTIGRYKRLCDLQGPKKKKKSSKKRGQASRPKSKKGIDNKDK